jgi:hypothetical protein
MPWRGGAAARSQLRQAVAKVGGKAIDSKHLDMRCRELNRQRQAVEPLADLRHQRRVRIAQGKVFDDRGYTLNEELYRCERCRFSGGWPYEGAGTAKRSKPVYMFALYPQRFPARRENPDPERSSEDGHGQFGHGIDNMFAIVEEQ